MSCRTRTYAGRNPTRRPSSASARAVFRRVVTRLCLDRMKSATARREQYVGTWLPEPVVGAPAEPMADDLSIALLVTLERLSSLERAAFLLHDVFDMDYGDIANTLGRSEESCRQLAARARQHVRDERPRFAATDESRERLFAAFEAVMTAVTSRSSRNSLQTMRCSMLTVVGNERRRSIRFTESRTS